MANVLLPGAYLDDRQLTPAASAAGGGTPRAARHQSGRFRPLVQRRLVATRLIHEQQQHLRNLCTRPVPSSVAACMALALRKSTGGAGAVSFCLLI